MVQAGNQRPLEGTTNARPPGGLRQRPSGSFCSKDVTARLLTEVAFNMEIQTEEREPSLHWSVVKTFFKWAFCTDLIAADPVQS